VPRAQGKSASSTLIGPPTGFTAQSTAGNSVLFSTDRALGRPFPKDRDGEHGVRGLTGRDVEEARRCARDYRDHRRYRSAHRVNGSQDGMCSTLFAIDRVVNLRNYRRVGHNLNLERGRVRHPAACDSDAPTRHRPRKDNLPAWTRLEGTRCCPGHLCRPAACNQEDWRDGAQADQHAVDDPVRRVPADGFTQVDLVPQLTDRIKRTAAEPAIRALPPS
jgi:hypothetical protein